MKNKLPRHLSKWRATRLRCDCMGYWFPHRKGGGACEHSPRRKYYEMLRAGCTPAEAMLEGLTAGQIEAMFPLRVCPD